MAGTDCTRTHTCAHCGTEFSGRKKRFCSTDCQIKAKTGHDPAGHKCTECGVRFTGRKRKYCSDECAHNSKLRRDRARNANNPSGELKYRRVAFRLEYPAGVETEADKRRWRYHYDLVYRAKEKSRQSRAKHERRYRKALTDDGTVTADHIQSRSSCLYCGTKLTKTNRTLDHMIPVVAGGHHSASNVVECCRSCNSSKGAKDFSDWLCLLEEPHRSRAEREYVKRKGAPPQQAPLFEQGIPTL